MIVAPLVARVTAEHSLPNWSGRARCPTVGTFTDSRRFCVLLREAGTLAVSDWSAQPHIARYAAK